MTLERLRVVLGELLDVACLEGAEQDRLCDVLRAEQDAYFFGGKAR